MAVCVDLISTRKDKCIAKYFWDVYTHCSDTTGTHIVMHAHTTTQPSHKCIILLLPLLLLICVRKRSKSWLCRYWPYGSIIHSHVNNHRSIDKQDFWPGAKKVVSNRWLSKQSQYQAVRQSGWQNHILVLFCWDKFLDWDKIIDKFIYMHFNCNLYIY